MAGDSALKPNVSPAARTRALNRIKVQTDALGNEFVVIAGVRYLRDGAIRDGAISSGASSFTAGSIGIAAAAWTEVQNCSMTTGGGAVRIDFSCAFAASLPVGAGVNVQYRIKRGATVIRTGMLIRAFGGYQAPLDSNPADFVVVIGNNSGHYHFFMIDADAPISGSHSWSVEISQIATGTVEARSMALLETRK